ncbi:MAG: hypothetical protein DMF91_03155 [Acidobacteria bacterium]|nr:MAG: hypothetical protein DMF91_03155 [Acidobacteriota bacterium]
MLAGPRVRKRRPVSADAVSSGAFCAYELPSPVRGTGAHATVQNTSINREMRSLVMEGHVIEKPTPVPGTGSRPLYD